MLRNVLPLVRGLLGGGIALVCLAVLLMAVLWGVRAVGGLFSNSPAFGVTVYPLTACWKPCEDFAIDGQKVARRRVPHEKETFQAFPEQQEVVRQMGGMIESLTRDRHYACRVLSWNNWNCSHEISGSPNRSESFVMTNGELSYTEWPFDDSQGLLYSTWCMWQQVRWHNFWSARDDLPWDRSQDSTLHQLLFLGVFVTSGCALPSDL